MISKLKLILLCPAPEDQKPIVEYIGLKENFNELDYLIAFKL